MDSPRKLYVGYDLCADFTQICCYSYKMMEPVPISEGEGEDNEQIPTALCYQPELKQWLIGEEALVCEQAGKGIAIEELYRQVQSEDEIEICGSKYSGAALLEQYFRKTLTLIKNYFPTEPVTKLVITVRDTVPEFINRIYEALAALGLNRDRTSVVSHTGVYLYYALSQDKALWMNDVGMFDFTREGFWYYQIKLNRRTSPMLACLMKTDYSDSLKLDMLHNREADPAYILENITNNALHKQIISTLYFTGAGFLGDWAQETIRGLCKGRRIFMGQNLYSKGACYAAKELSGESSLSDFMLFNDDMLHNTVAAKLFFDSVLQEVPLIRAGENWYEVNYILEVIVQGDTELELELTNIVSKEHNSQRLKLPAFPDREERMTRLSIHLICRDRNTLDITITDLGFGEIYPGTGEIVEYSITV